MAGLFGIALSGAGPSVLALSRPVVKPNRSRVAAVFEAHGVKAIAVSLKIDRNGRYDKEGL